MRADCKTSEQSELLGKRYESRVVSFASLRCESATVGRVGSEWPLMGIRSTDADRRQQELHSVTFMILPHALMMRDYENEIEASTWCKDKSSIYCAPTPAQVRSHRTTIDPQHFVILRS